MQISKCSSMLSVSSDVGCIIKMNGSWHVFEGRPHRQCYEGTLTLRCSENEHAPCVDVPPLDLLSYPSYFVV